MDGLASFAIYMGSLGIVGFILDFTMITLMNIIAEKQVMFHNYPGNPMFLNVNVS